MTQETTLRFSTLFHLVMTCLPEPFRFQVRPQLLTRL
jgi:hypothetical protein